MKRFGAIEAGGTKFVCGAGTGPDDLVTERIDTLAPDATVAQAVRWLRDQGELAAIGIGSFGPIDLKAGRIGNAPKSAWRNYNLAGAVREALNVPVAFDTDVNAALAGETACGAARAVSNCIYVTVGTGIGAAATVSGARLAGTTHPEMGHIRMPHDLALDAFAGCCPFHGDCLEGLASGPAIEARWQTAARNLPPQHAAWDLEAHYLALGLAAFTCILAPERILLGGGVMEQTHLFPKIRSELHMRCSAATWPPLKFFRPNSAIAPACSELSMLAQQLAKDTYANELRT